MFCVLFWLSMHYEIFLLSRTKKEWGATGDNQAAVAFGLRRTGGLITAAASLLVIVFLSIATSGISLIKMLGVGTALAIIVDATLIRCVLGPRVHANRRQGQLVGAAAPRRLHNRIGLS